MLIKDTNEYMAIHREWHNEFCKRTEVCYMRHIDDGLFMLSELKAPDVVKQAWCIHPFAQGTKCSFSRQVSINAAFMAAKYAKYADMYLSHDEEVPAGLADALKEADNYDVAMLLAVDKWQNFEHFDESRGNFSQEDRDRLDNYFTNWKAMIEDFRPGIGQILDDCLAQLNETATEGKYHG